MKRSLILLPLLTLAWLGAQAQTAPHLPLPPPRPR